MNASNNFKYDSIDMVRETSKSINLIAESEYGEIVCYSGKPFERWFYKNGTEFRINKENVNKKWMIYTNNSPRF